MPTATPVSEVLGKWLAKHGQSDEAARLLEALNREIEQDEVAIGPSYFMTNPDEGPDIERIWARAITPLLEEYYYGTTWDPARFSLGRLRAQLDGSAVAQGPANDEAGVSSNGFK